MLQNMFFKMLCLVLVIAATEIMGAGASIYACDNAVELEGNWYCGTQGMDTIIYTNVGMTSGSYDKITGMDASSGACTWTSHSFSSAMAPLDEEVSLHFRGPIHIKQIAAYRPNSLTTTRNKRDGERDHPHKRRHRHEETKRAVGDWVTATIDGQVVSWINEYDGEAAKTNTINSVTMTVDAVETIPAHPKHVSVHPIPSKSADPTLATSESWIREAYYDSVSQSKEGLVFLNNKGGSMSGTWDINFGNSLSYASSDGTGSATSAQTLEDCLIDDDTEIIVFTDSKCTSERDCGYYRDGTVAYHGFDGARKAFLVEFEMPLSGKTGNNGDMPAFWMLNAQIPRTLQYGWADCSCWESGCGEFDVFEILSAGQTRAKSTFHMNTSGGDGHWFQRPTNSSMKLAVVFEGTEYLAAIKVLDDDFVFAEELSALDVTDLCAAGPLTSTFALS